MEQQGVFSSIPVFIMREQAESMRATIVALEEVFAEPAFQTFILQDKPATAQKPSRVKGVFFGYDFHVGPERPQLIEINTNAGGAFYNVLCAPRQGIEAERSVVSALELEHGRKIEDEWLAMFYEEWRLAGGVGPLSRIAIVDEEPEQQFLYPEFLLFQALFKKAGLECVICSPTRLQRKKGKLFFENAPIDLVYNRLTDFYLQGPACETLREAYLRDEVVLTPNPNLYGICADKRNLIVLSDELCLRNLGIAPEVVEQLQQSIPKTIELTKENADSLWQKRKQYFFKPMMGYGSKAAYRGEKLTKSTWQAIVGQGYVAQAFVPPSERKIAVDGQTSVLKVDFRNYTYKGKVQLLAARLYQGQTTNFRTVGGGFAPLYFESAMG